MKRTIECNWRRREKERERDSLPKKLNKIKLWLRKGKEKGEE